MPERPSKLKIYSLIAADDYDVVVKLHRGEVCALREFPPLLASGMRMVAAGFIMICVYGWHHVQPAISRLGRGMTCACWPFSEQFGVGLNQLFFVIGISMTTVSHAAIMIGLTPVTVLVLAAVMGLETLSVVRLLGMVIALGGVAVLSSPRRSPTARRLRATFLSYLASFTFAVYTVRGKRETQRLGGVVVNTFAYVGTAVADAPDNSRVLTRFRLFTCNMDRVDESWLYMAVFPSVVCYSIYYYALTHVPASRVSAFSYLQPLLATVMAIPLLGEHPTKIARCRRSAGPARRISRGARLMAAFIRLLTRESQLPVHLVWPGGQRVRRPLQ